MIRRRFSEEGDSPKADARRRHTRDERGERDGGAAHENEEEDVFGGCGDDSGGRQCGLRSVLPGFRGGYVWVDRCGEGYVNHSRRAVEDRSFSRGRSEP